MCNSKSTETVQTLAELLWHIHTVKYWGAGKRDMENHYILPWIHHQMCVCGGAGYKENEKMKHAFTYNKEIMKSKP